MAAFQRPFRCGQPNFWTPEKKRYVDVSADSMFWFTTFSRGCHSILARMVQEYGRLLLRSAQRGDNNSLQQLLRRYQRAI
jgi:hypothetical protein